MKFKPPWFRSHTNNIKQRRQNFSDPPTDDELAKYWMNLHPLTCFGVGSFMRYVSGVWKQLNDIVIRREILEVLERVKNRRVRPNASRISSVFNLACAITFVSNELWDARTDLIPCGNGVYDISTHQLIAHNPDFYFTSGLSFDYDPHAVCPNFQHALETTIPDVRDFLQEFAGYCLTTDTSQEMAVWFYGPSGSGKSTIISGLQVMMGLRAGILGLVDMEKSRFSLTNIIGKTLLVSTENPGMSITTSPILNAIISGEPIFVDRKFKDPIEVIPRTKLIWAMNELPEVRNATDGLLRRVKIISFPLLPEDKQDIHLKEAISQEGPGILNWAIEGLDRLQRRGYFLLPQCVIDATSEFRNASDIVAQFVSEKCEKGAGHRAQAGKLYTAYKDWCVQNGHKPDSGNLVAEAWKHMGFTRRSINGHRFWEGIRIR
jgi:putative DNA primase/helicase